MKANNSSPQASKLHRARRLMEEARALPWYAIHQRQALMDQVRTLMREGIVEDVRAAFLKGYNSGSTHPFPCSDMNTHDLKIWPVNFHPVLLGTKRAELRKNDRGFKAGDWLHLREWNPETKEYTGNKCFKMVTHIAEGDPIPEGYVMLSISHPTRSE